MTSAPANLLAVRRLLLDHLNVDPNTVRSQDLEPGEVGIVGDPNHRGGYHCGSDRVVTNDYSVVESPRDRAGLTSDASALDVGLFEVRSGGRTNTLAGFSNWLVAQCEANTPDTRDFREVIYSPDGKTVKRWDRLRKRSTGDSSHLFHTHISYFRDAIKAGRDQTPVFHRYLTTIGLTEGNDMTPDQARQLDELHAALLDARKGGYGVPTVQMLRDASYSVVKGNTSTTWLGQTLLAIGQAAGIDPAELDAIRAAAREGAASAGDELVAAVLARLPADQALTRGDVEQAVRDAFAGGLAPSQG